MRAYQRTVIAAIATVATLSVSAVGTMASGASPVTRADFVYALDRAIGLQPVFPATPDFTDVPASSPYYGFIEAAYQKGYILGVQPGTFDPNGLLTRAEMAKIEVVALGDQLAALGLMSQQSQFMDDGTIPSWARGYVIEAVQLGLVHGYPNGKFEPQAYVTPSDEASFISQFVSVLNSGAGSQSQAAASIAVTADPSNAAVGQMVQLSATVKTASGQTLTGAQVSYKAVGPASAVISGNRFIAPVPGTYTVQATSGGAIGSTTVTVYGSAVAIRLVPSASIVADGQMTTTLKAELVDQSGNVVGNATGNVALYYMTHGGATSIQQASGTTATPLNFVQAIQEGTVAAVDQGIASFTLQAGLTPGVSDTLAAVMYGPGGTELSTPTQADTTLTTTAEQATSISIVAPKYLSANASTPTPVVVQVLDQAGQPMLFGSTPLTVQLQGPATFAGGATGQEGFLYYGTGNPSTPGSVSVPISSIQGETGTVTVTATATGLPAQTATMSAVLAGPPVAIEVTSPAVTSFSEAQAQRGLTFDVAIIDKNGYPVASAQTLQIEVLKNGTIAQNIRIDGYVQSTSGVLDNNAAPSGHFTVTDTGSGANAGSYMLIVSDPNHVLQPASQVSFTETPGPAARVVLTGPGYVPISDPTATITATLEDAYGNVVPTTGVSLTFANASSNPPPGVTLSATTATTQNGVATVTATAPVYIGTSYVVQVSGTGIATESTSFTVENTVAASLTVGFYDAYQGGDSNGQYTGNGGNGHSTTTAEASDTVQIQISAVDQYGHAVQNEANNTIDIQFSNSGLVPTFSSNGALTQIGTNEWATTLSALGTVDVTATAETAGTTEVTVTDASLQTTSAGSGAFSVVPGRVWNYEVLTGSNTTAATAGVAVQGGVPVQLLVTPVDEYGNPTVALVGATIYLSDNGGGGTFSLSPGGTPVTSITMTAGQSQQTVYYTNHATGTYHISAS